MEILQSWSNLRLFDEFHIRKVKIIDSDIQSESKTTHLVTY